MKSDYTICDKCDKKITYGEPYVVIQRNVEHAEINKTNNGVDAYILDSELLITFCNTCSRLYNHDALISIIKTMHD